MGIEIANVWHFNLRLYLKPALGELYKKDSLCTKIRQFKIQYRKISPLGAFGASILLRLRRSNLAFPQFFLGNNPWLPI